MVHPDFLDRTIGHFYRQEDELGSSSGSGSKPARGWHGWRLWRRGAKGGCAADDKAGDDKGEAANGTAEEGGGGKQAPKARWVPKEKAGFIQTPQDFFNVDAKDPVRAAACLLPCWHFSFGAAAGMLACFIAGMFSSELLLPCLHASLLAVCGCVGKGPGGASASWGWHALRPACKATAELL